MLFFFKQVSISPEIDWLCYQCAMPAKMRIVPASENISIFNQGTQKIGIEKQKLSTILTVILFVIMV